MWILVGGEHDDCAADGADREDGWQRVLHGRLPPAI